MVLYIGTIVNVITITVLDMRNYIEQLNNIICQRIIFILRHKNTEVGLV